MSKAEKKAAAEAEAARRAAEKSGGNGESKSQTPATESNSSPDQAQLNAPTPDTPTEKQDEPKDSKNANGYFLFLAEKVEKLEKALQDFQKEMPAEKRLGSVFDLKLKTAAMKLGQEVGEKAASAAEMAKKALESANDASEDAGKAVGIAESAKEMIDQVLKVANEALDNVTIITDAVTEMRQIGDFVDKKYTEMENLVAQTRTEMDQFRVEMMPDEETVKVGQPILTTDSTETETKKPWQRG